MPGLVCVRGVIALAHAAFTIVCRFSAVVLLRVDAGYGRYGEEALESLLRGADNDLLTTDDYRGITDRLLACTAWWAANAQDDPSVIPEPVFVLSDAPEAGDDHPAVSWLKTAYRNRTMSDEQLARWLELQPPPVIGLETQIGPDGAALLYVEYGRRWQVIRGVVYPVDTVTVRRITIDGQYMPFTLVEAADSVSQRGYESAVVRFSIEGITWNKAISAGRTRRLTVEYDVAIFGRAPGSFGPFTAVYEFELSYAATFPIGPDDVVQPSQ